MKKSQIDMYYDAVAGAGRGNALFMELVKSNDLTNEELKTLVDKYPARWGRFAGFIGTLSN